MTASEGYRDGMRPEDANLLARIMDAFEAVDPMPCDLPERIRFALALSELDAEVARFSGPDERLLYAARSTEESRTVTFDSDSLTIMIRVDPNPDGTARVDGWLAPPQPHRVEMRLADGSITEVADQLGRFVFSSVPRGMVRLIVHPPEAEAAKSVITPALTLLASACQQRNGVRWRPTVAECWRATPGTPPSARGACAPD